MFTQLYYKFIADFEAKSIIFRPSDMLSRRQASQIFDERARTQDMGFYGFNPELQLKITYCCSDFFLFLFFYNLFFFFGLIKDPII